MFEGVARAIDAGRLPVPHAEDAVVAGSREESGDLASKDRRRAEILVHARKEANLVLLENPAGALEREVEASEWRASIARDQRRRPESLASIRAMLIERQPDQGLNPGEQEWCLLRRDTSNRG
jgi:hypothetical protein